MIRPDLKDEIRDFEDLKGETAIVGTACWMRSLFIAVSLQAGSTCKTLMYRS